MSSTAISILNQRLVQICGVDADFTLCVVVTFSNLMDIFILTALKLPFFSVGPGRKPKRRFEQARYVPVVS
ncbi:hypothetical protein Tco_0522271 [Tanacetum coccineum]